MSNTGQSESLVETRKTLRLLIGEIADSRERSAMLWRFGFMDKNPRMLGEVASISLMPRTKVREVEKKLMEQFRAKCTMSP